MDRFSYVKDEHLEFLDDLRESGEVNMFGAKPYLMQEFRDLNTFMAEAILKYYLGIQN